MIPLWWQSVSESTETAPPLVSGLEQSYSCQQPSLRNRVRTEKL